MTSCGLMVVAARYRHTGLPHGALSTIATFAQHVTTEPGTE